ncbi:AraC family transcriptional regulator [Aestuariivivens sediminis]|uniref:AraC family transcriptional regulator n=1 Tax=Aestuariivivens sediminis TaxID=2913557 RepID=UPI001F57A538|nr:AraC family transcriptional regulator [Aestuariivivens sediminis]
MMKLHQLDRSSINNSSFTTKIDDFPYFLRIWHYHTELELVVILASEGTCFIGDSIDKFGVGDVVLIGKNMPHMWLNDNEYFQVDSKRNAKAIAIHFKEDSFGKGFFEIPEMIHLLELFSRAKFGLKFLDLNKIIIKKIENLHELEGFEKTISFLQILDKLAKHKNTKSLSSLGFLNLFETSRSINQDKVQSYIFRNFNKSICLEDVAKIANMNPSAFSRFFKKVNRKTFSRYVTEIRIGFACKLLLEKKLNIAGVCYESGFNNISNFNRQFKIIMHCTPSEYLKRHNIES